MSETSSFDISPEQQAAIEDYAEKRGVSLEMAGRAIRGERVESEGPVAAPKEPIKHRGSYDRSFYEGEKRLSEEFPYSEDDELTPEDIARKSEQITKIRDEVLSDRFTRKAERMIPIDPENFEKSKAAQAALAAALRVRSEDHPHAS